MKSIRSLYCIVFLAFLNQGANAQSPSTHGSETDAMWGYRAPATYKVIPAPPSKKHSHAHAESPAFRLESKPIEPYAYGWFGAKTSSQWSRQFGNRNAFTQWTLK